MVETERVRARAISRREYLFSRNNPISTRSPFVRCERFFMHSFTKLSRRSVRIQKGIRALVDNNKSGRRTDMQRWMDAVKKRATVVPEKYLVVNRPVGPGERVVGRL